MLITKFDPFKQLREIEKSLYSQNTNNEGVSAFVPTVNTREAEFAYHIDVDLPGVKKEDIQMELKDGYLKVTATHGSNTEDKDEKGRVVRKERVSGSYSRSFYVGEGIHQEDVKASFDNGELKIVVPKEAPKQVEENKFIPIE